MKLNKDIIKAIKKAFPREGEALAYVGLKKLTEYTYILKFKYGIEIGVYTELNRSHISLSLARQMQTLKLGEPTDHYYTKGGVLLKFSGKADNTKHLIPAYTPEEVIEYFKYTLRTDYNYEFGIQNRLQVALLLEAYAMQLDMKSLKEKAQSIPPFSEFIKRFS